MDKYTKRENRTVAYEVVKKAFDSPSLDALVKVIVDYREQKMKCAVNDDLKEEIENCLIFIIGSTCRYNYNREIDSWIDEGYWDNDDEEDEDKEE